MRFEYKVTDLKIWWHDLIGGNFSISNFYRATPGGITHFLQWKRPEFVGNPCELGTANSGKKMQVPLL